MINKEEKAKVIADYGKTPSDTGSIEVQIAMLSTDIDKLNGHSAIHAHDFSSKRGLLKKVSKRRRFLQYLKDTDQNKYLELINKLGLRK